MGKCQKGNVSNYVGGGKQWLELRILCSMLTFATGSAVGQSVSASSLFGINSRQVYILRRILFVDL